MWWRCQGARRSRRHLTPGAVRVLAATLAVVGWNTLRSTFVPPPGPKSPNQLQRRGLLCAAGTALFSSYAWPASTQAAELWRSLPSQGAGPCAYPVRFTSYLTRFLLNFDSNFLWYYQASGDSWPLNQLESSEFEQDEVFGKFARTVEIALGDYSPSDGGAERLFNLLLDTYGASFEARRQICILFALLQDPKEQPVEPLRQLLRTVENSSVASVSILEPGEFEVTQPVDVPSQVVLEIAAPPAEDGRSAKIVCGLRSSSDRRGSKREGRRANATRFSVDTASLVDAGRGYASDVDLQPKLILPPGFRQVKSPSFDVKLARRSTVSADQRKALPGLLSRKLTALLPSSLLPSYSQRLGILVSDQSVPLTSDPTASEERRRLDQVFGEGRQLDRFRADFVFAEFDPTYGPVGLSPFERERPLALSDYLLLSVSGGIAGFLKEFALLPVKTVKYRLQTDPSLGGQGMVGAFASLSRREPWQNFYRGGDVACLVALLFSIVSFGATEYVKRQSLETFPQLNEVVALIFASAVGTILGLMLVTPLEVVSAQLMSFSEDDINVATGREEAEFWGLSVIQRKVGTDGVAAVPELYSEFWLLAIKEVAFVVTKFVVFDAVREALLFLVPAFVEDQSVLTACSCGAVAGALATVVSHPVDTIFALRASGSSESDDSKLPGLDVLFRGVGARILLFSPGIALLFLFYDVVKTTLGVGGNTLLQTLDLLGPAARSA